MSIMGMKLLSHLIKLSLLFFHNDPAISAICLCSIKFNAHETFMKPLLRLTLHHYRQYNYFHCKCPKPLSYAIFLLIWEFLYKLIKYESTCIKQPTLTTA